jgi:hypothetical protein
MLKFDQFGFFFIYFSLAIRFFQLVYIDIAGPFYSIELNREIGIFPFAEFLFLLLYFPLIYFANKIKYYPSKRILLISPRRNIPLKIIETLFLSFLICLYFSLFVNYQIPLFNNIDRIEFNKISTNSIHEIFRSQFYLVISVLFYLFYYYKIYYKKYSLFYVGIFLLILMYCFLTGNRWSIFFTLFAFFLFVRAFFVGCQIQVSNNIILRVKNSKFLISFFLLLLLFAIGNVLYTSFTLVRGYENVAEVFFNRAVLENVGVFQSLYDNENFEFNILSYFDFIPIDEKKSKAMQFLMSELSNDNNYINQIEGGQVFSGGFPDFLFYVSNYFAFIPIILISFLFSLFIKLMLKDLVKTNIILFLLGIQCVFPFFLFFTSGFVDFFTNPVWYLKLFLFVILYFYYGVNNHPKLQFNKNN